MRVIIIHHILWAHYKNAFYEELQQQAGQEKDLDVKILQIARTERSREAMQLKFQPTYSHRLLFDAVFEEIPTTGIFKEIIHEINTFKPQVVNINGFFNWYYILTAIYCKLRGIKVILSNDSTANDNPKIWWKTILKRLVIKISDAYYAFGTLSADYLLEYGADDTKIISRHGAVVNNKFIRKSFDEHIQNKSYLKKQLEIGTSNNFIFVGRFVELKNLPLLLRAFKAARSQAKNEDWGVILLGDGMMRQPLEEQVSTEQIKDIYFLGGKSWHEVPEFLTLAEVLVLPSSSEPWGLVVNEAMICGLPVVVSNKCGSCFDLVQEGQTGFSFDYHNETQLTEILLKFMNNTVDYQAMSRAATEKVAEFSVEKAAKDMIDGFSFVMKK